MFTFERINVDGVEIFEIGTLENIYKVGTEHLQEKYRSLIVEESILKKASSKANLTEEIATRAKALNFYSLVNILPDPDIVLRKQGKDMRIYKELLCDPHVFACVQSRKAGVLSLDWEN